MRTPSIVLAVVLVGCVPDGDEVGPPGLVFVAGGASVASFHLMPTEVTNEQYAEFVRATGRRPPFSWGAEAQKEGRVRFLEEDAERRRAELERGLRRERARWDPARWWDEHWRGEEWEVPTELLDVPVVYVSHEEAAAYARWAGLRLMSAEEQAWAARDHPGHRGADFQDGPAPVGRAPDGAVLGLFDLAGNVWEWTRTEVESASARDSLYLVVGASFAQEQDLPASVRQPTAEWQRTMAVGFRCAGSSRPCLHSAMAVARVLDGIALEPERVVGIERWRSRRGAAGERLASYAVVTGHDLVMFLPATLESGPELGVFVSTVPFPGSGLVPGAYTIELRQTGEDETSVVFVDEADQGVARILVPPESDDRETEARIAVDGAFVQLVVPIRANSSLRLTLEGEPESLAGPWWRTD